MNSNPTRITVTIWNQTLQLETDPRLFSPRQADTGSLAMINLVKLKSTDRLLDLGCGYGLVGLAAAKVLGAAQVVMVDIDPLAAEMARQNAEMNDCAGVKIIVGDGPLAAAPDHFSVILCNPPYHTDFAVARRLIEQSYRMLDLNGQLCMVVKRLPWYQNKMKAVFGGVRVYESEGYFILISEKRPAPEKTSTTKKDAQLPRKHLKRMQQSAQKKQNNRVPNDKKTGQSN